MTPTLSSRSSRKRLGSLIAVTVPEVDENGGDAQFTFSSALAADATGSLSELEVNIAGDGLVWIAPVSVTAAGHSGEQYIILHYASPMVADTSKWRINTLPSGLNFGAGKQLTVPASGTILSS